MGDNFVWLARERYPQRKIIVWAATFHTIRNLYKMDESVKDLRLMGDPVWEAFGEQTYNIAFTACEGVRGWVGQDETPIALLHPDSLEAFWSATGQSNAFLDVRALPAGGEWLNEPTVSYLMNGEPVPLYWRQMLDAAVFIRTMHRSTAVDS
jgi:erythromycin esterase